MELRRPPSISVLLAGLALALAGASAAPDDAAAKPKRFPILRWLVREKYLSPADFAPIREKQAEIDACFAEAKDAKKEASACAPPRLRRMRAQYQLFEKALGKLRPIEEKTKLQRLLVVKCERSMKELLVRIPKAEAELPKKETPQD